MIARRLAAFDVDQIVLSGDVTNTGCVAEGREFERLFAPLLAKHKLVIVPGNHDRGTDDYATRITKSRVWSSAARGLYFICADSTQPLSTATFLAHGCITQQDIEQIVETARRAPARHFVALVLHHHLFEARPDSTAEGVADAFRLPFSAPLDGGRELLARLPPNVQAVFHGHRHQPTVRKNVWGTQLSVYNGGSTSELGAFRVFEVEGARLVSEKWMQV